MVDFEDRNLAYGAIAGSLFLMVSYHFIMYWAVLSGRAPSTQLSLNIRNSLRWVLKHREKSDAASVTLAIQTFRNTILVAVFVGGNAFTQAFNFADGYQSSVGNPIEQARYIVLAALLFGSFLSWACVIRFVAHLGYIFGTLSHNVPPPTAPVPVATPTAVVDGTGEEAGKAESTAPQKPIKHVDDPHTATVKECIRIMSLNMIFFSLGFRFLFMALPFAFLSMGGAGLIIATAVMLFFFFFYDYGNHLVTISEVDLAELKL